MPQPIAWDGVQFIFVKANGIRFEVAEAGCGDRLALCLHGFPEHAYSWRHQIPVLALLGFHVWAPNLRGYGNTDSPAEVSAYCLETLIEDVAELIRASGATETLLIAHDWGGALAWMLAMRQPALVNRLVILNLPHPACFAREIRKPPQLLKSWYMLVFRIPRFPEWLLTRNHAAAIQDMFRHTSRDPARFSEEVMEVYRWNASRPGGMTAMLNWYRALFRFGGLRNIQGPFPSISIPTLFLWGDADSALSIRTTDGTGQYVSKLTFHILPGVSHWIQQEAPETVNGLLRDWLLQSPE